MWRYVPLEIFDFGFSNFDWAMAPSPMASRELRGEG
jgi:hypothetical protein